ncbi:Ig-like domain-containing protein [Denitrobaculum tricleocarpae]|uniref:VWFA domain-containing protein n=1 Tax=Denitrobaculum tricleocarpae TaxID=2591009 RepID=A0A545U174_9PROT|nr:hypothetical protein [Denitrobaculum tricleocarpae]TQV83237.1 hypothetical protein FKG95_01145 [Denitrobaculum tricleocarpae]
MTEQQSNLSSTETSEKSELDSQRTDASVETGTATAIALGQAAAPEPLVVTQPATGQTQEISLEAGQPVLLTMAADETFIAVDGANFVLSFDGDGDGAIDTRVVFLNLVDQAGSENPPQFVIGGQVVSSGLLVTQTIALGGGNGDPIPFETAAGEVAVGGGNNVYDDDLGSAIDLLLAQDVIPPTALVFGLPDPEPGLALDLTSDVLDDVPPPPPPPSELFAPVDFDISVTAERNFGPNSPTAPNVTEGVLDIGLEEEVPGFFFEFQVGFEESPDDNIRGTDVEDGTTENFTITSLPEEGFLAIDTNGDGIFDTVLGPADIGTERAEITTANEVRYFLPLNGGDAERPELPESVRFTYFTTDSDGLTSDGAVVTIDFENGLPGVLTVEPDVGDIRPNREGDANAPETSVTIDVLANDSHSEGLPLTLESVDFDPALGTAVIVDDQIVFTPAAGVTETTVQFTYTVTTPDGLSEQTTVDVTIGKDVSVQSIVEVPDSSPLREELLSQIVGGVDTYDVDGADGTATDPFDVNVELYPNSDVTFTVTADPDLPDVLDLYLLQDLSGSFRDDLPEVRGDQNASSDAGDLGLLDDLVNGVEGLAGDVQFGLGSFRDEITEGDDPDRDAGSLELGQYAFRHHLDLAPGEGGERLDGVPTDAPGNPNEPAGEGAAYDELFAGDPDSDEATGLGGDNPEKQLFALNEVAKDAARAEDNDGGTSSDFGFRSGSAKVVVILTDATSHDTNNAAFMEQLRTNLQVSGIIPIFLVAPGVEGADVINEFYDNLIEDLQVGVRVPLEADSSDLVEAIEKGLNQINQDLTLEVEGDENGYVSIGEPDIDPETGEHIWEVTLSAPLDKGHNNDDDITLKVTNDASGEQVGGDINVDVTTDAAANGGDDFDIVEGHNGQNVLNGGAGNDLIIGLGGDDILIGGEGNDVFAFGARDNGDELDFDGNDIIQDFTIGEDQVNLEALLDALGIDDADRKDSVTVEEDGGNTVITVDGATDFTVTLTGITDTLTVGNDPNSDIVI